MTGNEASTLPSKNRAINPEIVGLQTRELKTLFKFLKNETQTNTTVRAITQRLCLLGEWFQSFLCHGWLLCLGTNILSRLTTGIVLDAFGLFFQYWFYINGVEQVVGLASWILRNLESCFWKNPVFGNSSMQNSVSARVDWVRSRHLRFIWNWPITQISVNSSSSPRARFGILDFSDNQPLTIKSGDAFAFSILAVRRTVPTIIYSTWKRDENPTEERRTSPTKEMDVMGTNRLFKISSHILWLSLHHYQS